VSSSTNPNQLYERASADKDSSIDFWGEVPQSFQDAVNLAKKRYSSGDLRSETNPERLRRLKEVLTEYHKENGILTPAVRNNINKLDTGSILVGQQPVLMGGPGFIGNKIACLIHLTTLYNSDSDQKLAPIYFVGDYDGLQKELARQYFPNPISHNAFIIDSEDYLPEESDIAAHAAQLPPVEWLEEYLGKLEDNLRGFKSHLKGDKKKLFDERWDHIKTVLRTTLYDSETLSEWATRIWGIITNVIQDYGVVYLPTSHPEIRKLIAQDYLPFIQNSQLYADTFQEAMNQLEKMGYEPTLPHRHADYAPFTLECEADSNRITTTLVEKGGEYYAEGTCPACDEFYSYKVSTADDLLQIATLIGPRVDSSQAVFQDLMNIRIRISGPGEIAYYSLAAPAVSAIGFEIPTFVKYKRAFYNATWIEELGKQLVNRDQGGLQQGELFKILRQRTDAIKNGQPEEIREAEQEMKNFIDTQFEKLLEVGSVDSEKYLGWQYGRFTPQKFGQEVSWIWFDMALQTGLTDYIGTYLRMYTPHSSLGGYFFINSLL